MDIKSVNAQKYPVTYTRTNQNVGTGGLDIYTVPAHVRVSRVSVSVTNNSGTTIITYSINGTIFRTFGIGSLVPTSNTSGATSGLYAVIDVLWLKAGDVLNFSANAGTITCTVIGEEFY